MYCFDKIGGLQMLRGKLIPEQVPLGIDLGRSSIKIVELSKLRSKFVLKRFTIEEFSVPQDDEGDNQGEQIGQYLRECLDKYKIKNKNAYLAIKNDDVVIRTISFPPMPQSELAQAVDYEADNYIMMPKNQANVDWHILKQDEHGITVLLLAARKDLINKYHEVCETAGIKLKALDVEVFSLKRLVDFLETHNKDNFSGKVDGHLTLTLDMGAGGTTLLFTKKNNYVFSRNISIGGMDFTKAISQEAGISFQEAEQNKDQVNYLEYNSVLGQAQDLLREIARSVEYVNSQKLSKGDPEQLYVTGGGWRMKGLLDYIRENLGTTPEIVNPFKHIKSRGELVTEGMMASIATGLALRRWTK